MRRMLRMPNVPSPGLIVATTALVVSMSGVGLAASMITSDEIKNRTIAGRDVDRDAIKGRHIKEGKLKNKHIKDGTLTGAEIRDRTLTAADIKDASLTGKQVNESTLEPVPVAKEVAFLKPFNLRMAFGQDVVVASNGEVSVRARCLENDTIDGGANLDGIQLYARTTAAGSFMNGADDRPGDTNGDGLIDAESLDPTDAVDDSTVLALTAPAGGPNEQVVTSQIDQGFVTAPDGTYIGIDSEMTALGVRGFGVDCAAIGTAQISG